MKYAKKAGYVIATILFLIFTLGPFVWTFIMAVTPKAAMFAPSAKLVPDHITWDNFKNLLSGGRRSVTYFTGLKNSMRAVVITICIGMPVSMMSAYALSRMEFPGRKLIKNTLLITMVIPVMATIIPLYRMFSAGKLLDNIFWLSAVYVSAYLPMATWMITNYLSTIPKELEEAAKIDGCNAVQTLVKVIVPMLSPAITSIALFQFMWSSNDFMGPLLYVNTPAKYPLAIFVKMSMDADSGFQWNRILALSLISIIPSLVVFFMAQDKFVDGISAGGVKG